jgi:hypothetical protein
MRTMSHILLLLALISLCLFSCKKNYDDTSMSQSVKDKISSHCFSAEGAQKTEGGYIVEGDIFLPESFFDQNPSVQNLLIGRTQQFQTNNIVTGLPRTITISLSAQLPLSYSAALNEAISRFNNEHLSLHFARTTANADINIEKGVGTFLAISGFPNGDGNPYNTIKLNTIFIGNGNTSSFTNYVATIITHEIGHCIGFRHTDYVDRSFSCGGKSMRESCGYAGAVLIPGTVAVPDRGSWMLTCISAGENRPFTAYDQIALRYLYQ